MGVPGSAGMENEAGGRPSGMLGTEADTAGLAECLLTLKRGEAGPSSSGSGKKPACHTAATVSRKTTGSV